MIVGQRPVRHSERFTIGTASLERGRFAAGSQDRSVYSRLYRNGSAPSSSLRRSVSAGTRRHDADDNGTLEEPLLCVL